MGWTLLIVVVTFKYPSFYLFTQKENEILYYFWEKAFGCVLVALGLAVSVGVVLAGIDTSLPWHESDQIKLINGKTVEEVIGNGMLKLIAKTTEPTCEKGAVYYNGAENKPYYCDGTNWKPLTGAGSICDPGGALYLSVCWYKGVFGESCNDICSSHAGTYGNCDWRTFDNDECLIAKLFYGCSTGCVSASHIGYDPSGGNCYYQSTPGECSSEKSLILICACNS